MMHAIEESRKMNNTRMDEHVAIERALRGKQLVADHTFAPQCTLHSAVSRMLVCCIVRPNVSSQ